MKKWFVACFGIHLLNKLTSTVNWEYTVWLISMETFYEERMLWLSSEANSHGRSGVALLNLMLLNSRACQLVSCACRIEVPSCKCIVMNQNCVREEAELETKVKDNERRRYCRNVFSHWLIPCFNIGFILTQFLAILDKYRELTISKTLASWLSHVRYAYLTSS